MQKKKHVKVQFLTEKLSPDFTLRKSTVHMRWLNVKHQTVPVLVFYTPLKNNLGGGWFIFVFLNGLRKPPIQQPIAHAPYVGSSRAGMSFQVDKRGFMSLKHWWYDPDEKEFAYRNQSMMAYWQGNRFVFGDVQ